MYKCICCRFPCYRTPLVASIIFHLLIPLMVTLLLISFNKKHIICFC
jgi:hypothetical protein